jgi:hypothetical protein
MFCLTLLINLLLLAFWPCLIEDYVLNLPVTICEI